MSKPSWKIRYWALSRLLKQFAPYRYRFVLVLFLGLLISVIQPICLRLTERAIDGLQTNVDDAFFKWVPWILAIVFLVSGIAKYTYNSLRRFIAEHIVITLRTQLFQKYLAFPLAVVDGKRAGDMVASLQNDLTQVAVGLDTLCDFLKEPFIFLGLMGIAFYYDWQLALVTLLAAPLVVFLFSRSGAAVKRYSNRNLGQFSDLISVSQEAISGARVVKVFQLERTLEEKFHNLHESYFATLWKSVKVQELATPAVEFVGACMMGGIIVYGKYRISAGNLTTGELIAFILALGLVQMPIKKLNNAYLKIKHAEAAGERVFAVLDTPIGLIEKRGAYRLSRFDYKIEYEGVGLHYGDKRALGEVTFSVSRGQRIALVGPSGSGKTSLVNCLPRLYEVTEGAIRVDGMDIRDIRLDDLRSLISFVTQDVFLFHDTIYENIRYGKPSATREEVVAAAEAAHCLPFIECQPYGFHTKIGDRGVRVSGGERQRIAIARALLKSAPLLVLDEATSSLDATSEALVQKALDSLMEGRTTFIVAHRFSTVRRADHIFVLENGRIREQGAHDSLLQSKGLYSQLFHEQLLT